VSRKMKLLACSIGLLAFVAALPATSKASTVIYSDFGSNNNYDCCEGYTISGSNSVIGTAYSDAMLFTSGANYSVTQLDVAVGYVTGTNGAQISIAEDNGGIPGTSLGSWAVTGLTTFGNCCDVATVSGITGVDLLAGWNYFVVVDPGGSDTWDAWNLNTVGAIGQLDQSNNGVWNQYTGSTLGAFDVLGNPSGTTPEPATLLLLGTGLLGIYSRRRRKV